MKKISRKIFATILVLSILFSTIAFSATASTDPDITNKLYPTGLIVDSPETIENYMITETAPATRATSIDLTLKFPSPGNQGNQGSCVAWAVGYALKSSQEQIRYNWTRNTPAHNSSPAYIYNQINGGVDQGATISSGMNLVVTKGAAPMSYFPYNASNYTAQPTAIQNDAAALYKASSWSTISGTTSIKNRLAAGNGVVIGIKVYPDFDNISSSNQIYDNTSGTSRGSHAICLIGFDDSKGAYKFINSWGTGWGLSGYGWISYNLVNSATVNLHGAGVGYALTNRTSDDYVMGDVTGDGLVTVIDAREVLRYSVSIVVPTSSQYVRADIDGDGQITAVDANELLRYAMKIITTLPLYE